MPIAITPDPQNDPFDLNELKDQLRIEYDNTDHDSYLNRLLSMAIGPVQRHYNRQLITATFRQTLTRFKRKIWLRSPVQEVTSIEYVDEAGATQTYSAGDYELINTQRQDFVHLSGDFPALSEDKLYPVILTYDAGYGATHEDVPEDIKFFAYEVMATFYMQRETISTDRVYDVIDKLSRHLTSKRVFRFQ